MKRIIKNPIFTFILGILICGVGVYAANTYSADSIDYTTDKNNEVKNVKMALDDLYGKKITFGEASYSNTMSSYSTTSQRHSQELTKGKYLVLLIDDGALFENSTVSTSGTSNYELKCLSNNCDITELSNKYYYRTGTSKFSGVNYYITVSNTNILYYVEITDDSDTIYFDFSAGGTYTSYPLVAAFHVIPINS